MFSIRPATAPDIPALEALIALSARDLSQGFYTAEEAQAAIKYVFGVDSELVADGTYFVVEAEGKAIACGGWSKRRTLFGGDNYAGRQSGLLDPLAEPAKIRAFFIHPAWARKGLATLLLEHCEAEARKGGFTRIERMSTLPGVPFYAARAYAASAGETYTTPNRIGLAFVPMIKSLKN